MVAKAVERHRGKLKRRREKKQAKRIEEAVLYAINHVSRLEILILLNEGIFKASEITELTGISKTNVANHLKRMLEDGSIEVAKREERNGTMVFWYRAVKIPEYTREEAEKLTTMELQMIAGLMVQSATAEVMAALHKGTLASAKTILSWDWYNVDDQGWEEIHDEVAGSLGRLKDIACEAANRVAVSKEETRTIVVNVQGFERARKADEPRLR